MEESRRLEQLWRDDTQPARESMVLFVAVTIADVVGVIVFRALGSSLRTCQG